MLPQFFIGLLLIVSSSSVPSGIFDWKPEIEEGSSWCSPGLYSKGCSNPEEVTVCTDDGRVVDLVCPFSLWFDEESQRCLPPSDISVCRSMESNKFIAPAISLPSDFCIGLPDGFHAISECSSSVAHCVKGIASIFECPAGQIYSKKGCIIMDAVTGCHTRSNDDHCSSDGLFEVETCSPLFLSCGSGISRVMRCPWPLVFDPSLHVCNYDYEVTGCPLKENTMCPSDGFYSYGNCSDTFYACTGDLIRPMHCPSSLIFDDKLKLCNYPQAVPECREESSGSGSGDDSGSGESGDGSGSGESNGQEGTGEGSIDESSGSGFEIPNSRSLDNFCNNRADGFYAQGCSNRVMGCSNGITNYLFCPANLFFDEERTICEYPNALTGCEESGSGSGSGEESQVLFK